MRDAVDAGNPEFEFEVGSLNKVAAEAAGELGLPLLDLYRAFAADFGKNPRRYEFDYDWHWNSVGKRIVGEAIAGFLTSDPRSLAVTQ